MCDFETTTKQDRNGRVHVWAAAYVPITSDTANGNAEVLPNLTDFMEKVFTLAPCDLYFHNLKFDGMFIMSWMFENGYNAATYLDEEGETKWFKTAKMTPKSFKTLISMDGQWYNIEIITPKGSRIVVKDSLKILPFSVAAIGGAFKTAHRKTEIDYSAHNDIHKPITKKEREYIANDVFVVAEALQMVFEDGDTAATIGSNCMKAYKKTEPDFDMLFPNLYGQPLDGTPITDIGGFCRKSYGGAWTYVAPDKQNVVIKHGGITLDVNSLYPYVMHSCSGTEYPVGYPKAYDNTLAHPEWYYIVHFKCRFEVKPGYLPFVHIRGNAYYPPSKALETSDIDGHKYIEGELIEPEITMTKPEFELFLEHYDVDYTILDVVYFDTMKGIFDTYINHYYEEKAREKGAKRTRAKLKLNNLYGKFATSTDSSFKIPVMLDDGTVGFVGVEEYEKNPGYIPVGATITAAAKCYTIRAAQKNYHPGKPGFCYADTDSLHMDIQESEVVGVRIHGSDLGAWKCEGEWDTAIFVRAKCYVERVGGKYDIKCAGLPKNSKNLLRWSFGERDDEPDGRTPLKDAIHKMGKEAVNYASVGRTLSDFRVGLRIPGKLLPKIVPGGVILEETTYLIKKI